jgi:hypothetical protein
MATTSGILSVTVQCENIQWSQSYTDSGGGFVKHLIAIPAGKAGSSVKGTSSSVITLAAGHGFTDASLVAVSWAAGKRIGMTVSAYDATSITVTNSTGTGDTYPSGTTDVVVCTATAAPDVAFDGDNAAFLFVGCDQRATADFLDGDSVVLLSKEITTAGGGYYWSESSGVTRPITGNAVASVNGYNHSITAATITIGVILDS